MAARISQGEREVLKPMRYRVGSVLLTLLLLAWFPSSVSAGTVLKADEEVLFFPTSGHWDSQERVWRIPVHGWVFEREQDSVWRHYSVEGAAALLDIDGIENEDLFKERVWPFLVDSERDKELTISYGGEKTTTLKASEADGHIMGSLLVPEASVKQQTTLPWVKFEVVMPLGDERRFEGTAQLLCPNGLSVISDIDDTVKISNVLDKEALLTNTFLEEFRAVPSMSTVFRKWSAQGAAFHYASASPRQLYQPLATFLSESGFPKGSFHLRPFRLKGSSFFNILSSSAEFKKAIIEEILQSYPERRFVLVGDNGEKDPEVYGGIAVRHPKQIIAIYIRNVTGESSESGRMQAAFKGGAEDKWWLFRDTAALPDIIVEQGSEDGGRRDLCM